MLRNNVIKFASKVLWEGFNDGRYNSYTHVQYICVTVILSIELNYIKTIEEKLAPYTVDTPLNEFALRFNKILFAEPHNIAFPPKNRCTHRP